MRLVATALALTGLGLPLRVDAQTWGSDSAVGLARRAALRRGGAAADTTLHDYKAEAHGFLFFLGAFGEGLADPPRLVKADQLELEVYWRAPASSKQRVVGWRDQAELPTDINYHRDHLGIIQNNFGAAIRLGEGDEVRDVPHPLSSVGLGLYDFALGDTTIIALPEREVRVVALRVRPKSFDLPRIVGTLYLDAATADLVRMAFNFTPRSYLDRQLEDVSIVLDNALWEQRYWLPYRQEIEIRRRATWLEGLAAGAGLVLRGGGERRELRLRTSYGFGDRRGKGAVTVVERRGRGALDVSAYRDVRDVGDWPVIAPLQNSFAAQEFGHDYGDYYLAQGARLTYRHGVGVRGEWRAAASRESFRSLAVAATPANGSFRPNPALGGPAVDLLQLAFERRSEGFAVRRDLHVETMLEAGREDGGDTYLRLSGAGHVLLPVGATRLLIRAQGGGASARLPARRAFVLGGRGTLLGDPFRAWGGRRMGLVHVEWRVPMPFPSLGVGPYARTPRTVTLAPFVAMGWADRPVPGTPWLATDGARTTLGLGVEWLGVFRCEAGFGTATHRMGIAFDVSRDFWGIL